MPQIKTKPMTLEQAKELGIDSWSIWECEPSKFDWEYDEQETVLYLKEMNCNCWR